MPSGKVPHISVRFQLQLDYLEIFSCKSPVKAALIQADRQTDKYEANYRLCDYANALENLM